MSTTKNKLKRYNILKQECDNKRTDELDKLHKLELEVSEILSVYKGDSTNMLITYENLNSLGFDEWFVVGDGVRFMRKLHPTKPVFFVTEMSPELTKDGVARFNNQKHDCKELCEVIEGELIEPHEMNKRYEQGDTVVYPANFLHKPYSTIKSKYFVEFLPAK